MCLCVTVFACREALDQQAWLLRTCTCWTSQTWSGPGGTGTLCSTCGRCSGSGISRGVAAAVQQLRLAHIGRANLLALLLQLQLVAGRSAIQGTCGSAADGLGLSRRSCRKAAEHVGCS
jgi:hypothetical protein